MSQSNARRRAALAYQRQHGIPYRAALEAVSQPAGQLYNQIGRGYAEHRRPDPRIEAAIWAALGDAETVLNVGAGAGSYEPTDRDVLAVEPSAVMRAQRPAGAFFPAFWRRPQGYLDPQVRASTSVWRRVGEAVEQRVVGALSADLRSGAWHERNAELLDLDELDTGARLLVAS